MRRSELKIEMTEHEKNVTMPSRSARRVIVLGFYLSFPLWGWLLYSTNYGGAFPEGIGGYDNLEPWLAFGFFTLFAFCGVKLTCSSVGFSFSGPRDERQQAVLMRTYSLSYKILSAAILVTGSVLSVLSVSFGERLLPTSDGWTLVVSTLIIVTGSLPKAVAMWLEPDPVKGA